jgi:hypothetical protein
MLSRRSLLSGLATATWAQHLRFEPSGFFRVEKKDRWWFVTPDGRAFLSLSLNHAEPQALAQDYNRAHWLKQFGAEGTNDDAFRKGFAARVEADLEAFGFNSLGCHTPLEFWRPARHPYIQPFKVVAIDHYRTPVEADFPDVFSPAFEQSCEAMAKRLKLAELSRDPLLIGYAFTDCPILTEVDAAARDVVIMGAPRAATPTWPRVLRNLPASAPGKRAWVQFVQHRYGHIEAFNETYNRTFNSFDHLAAAVNWRPAAVLSNQAEARDNDEFLQQILDRYYATMKAVVRRHDPNHLILGDKLNGNTGTPTHLVTVAARHIDAVFYQWYGYYGEQRSLLDAWSRATGKPLFNGDSNFAVPDRNMPNPLGPDCGSQEERAQRMVEFGRAAFARADFIGWSVCGWMDNWNTMRTKEVRQHSGVQDPFGNHYRPVRDAMKHLSASLLR